MQRLFVVIALALAVVQLAAAPSATPSHPLSHIHPVDVDLNMSGREIFNVSNIKIQDGMNITKDSIQPGTYAGLGTDALKWNNSHQRWEVKNSNLSLENNEIQEFFDNKCTGGEVVAQVYDNGSYNCQSITDTTNDKYVNEAGDTMNGSLNFTDYSDYSINNVSNINNFFAEECSGDNVITEVNSDGSYNCTSTSTLNPVEDLSETLSEGNTADGNNINMTGENITEIGNLKDFFDSACSGDKVVDGINSDGTYDCVDADAQIDDLWVNETGDNLTGDLDLKDNDLIEVDELRTNGTGSDVIAVRDTDNTNDIARFKEGGNVEIPNGNLDLSDNNISNYWGNNLCSEDRAVQKVYRNGTVTCTEQIEFTDNTENLSETLQAGNVANQSIDMDGNNITSVGDLGVGTSDPNNKFHLVDDGETASSSLKTAPILAETSDQYVAEFLTSASYAGFLQRTESASGTPFVQFASGSSSAQWTVQSNNGNNFQIRDGNAGGTVRFQINDNGDVQIRNSNLDLQNNNISNYWGNNLCGADRAVQEIHENGTVTCTQQIEFTDNTENLSMTLESGNVANQSIDMDENVIENIGSTGTNFTSSGNLDLRNPGNTGAELDVGGSANFDSGLTSYGILDVQENAIENIDALQDNGQDTISFDGGDNVEIPNGDLNLTSEGNISDVNEIQNFFDTTCTGDGVVSGVNDDGTYSCVDPDAQVDDLWVNETGDNVTGDLDLNNNDLIEVDELRTNGTGSDTITIRDTDATNDIARFNEGGKVEVPNGILNVSGGDVIASGTSGPLFKTNPTDDSGIDNGFLIQDSDGNKQGWFVADGNNQDVLFENKKGGKFSIGISGTGSRELVMENGGPTTFDTDGTEALRLEGDQDIRVSNGNLNLSDNNITGYWGNNICSEDRAVQQVFENGTITCTEQIEFTDNTENLSMTLLAGNVANQSIFMDNNNITDTQYVDGVELDNPGTAIDINNNQYRVTPDSLTNSSINSFTSFTLQDLEITNDLTGTNIVNSNQINSGAVTSGKINDGAVTNTKINTESINSTQIQDDEVTSSDIASNAITKSDGQLDSSVAGNGLALNSNELDIPVSSALNRSENQVGVAAGGIDTTQLSDDAVTRAKIAKDGCSTDQVLEWTGSEWTCSNVDQLGQDNQTLAEVLDEGNQANQKIDMQDNNINDVGQINSNGQELEVGGNINTTGNNVTEVSRIDFESGDSATGQTGEDMCLGDRC